MRIVDRWFAQREEELAAVDEEFKACGKFRLGAFGECDSEKFSDVPDMISAVRGLMPRADSFYRVPDDTREFKLVDQQLTYETAFKDGTVNDVVHVQMIGYGRESTKAVVIVPHWNAKYGSYVPIAKALSRFGFASFIMTLPHHAGRAASSAQQIANEFLNADLGVAIKSVRQSVSDLMTLIGWLRRNGYREVHLIGVSLGSCIAALATAFDRRISHCALMLTAGDFAETVWTGRATDHIRRAIEQDISLEQLKEVWAIISPINFTAGFLKNQSRLLIISGRRDEVVRFRLATGFVEALSSAGVNVRWRVLPCGHYTLGTLPFAIISLIMTVRFLRKQ